ncbi:5-(carboxyamino)imidazole ribonucleotide synthase [Lentibacillus saliphilus]|uniref:5-(carboxyamino)imidazole ribonucleotide synthase n=1 Tax=Lentibacillus saliphilus TaxID=2737028 RepID=UPI001C30E42A|nr:5-(carboxyamino)imidazole ribonucleotide synthase [Lentibacillus saliphilus]
MQKSNVILPSQTIGIIGGGQLGRMMAIAAKYMGYQVVVLDPTPNCPTAQVADQQITAAYADLEAIKALTAESDVVTYEFENVDLEAAALIEAEGKLPQGAEPLAVTQNREKEKQLMKRLGLPVSPFVIVHNGSECREALNDISFPSVIKTCRGGYDGKGQLKLAGPEDREAAIAFAEANGHCIIESWVTFDKEVSVVFTRSQTGDIQFFPLAENEHRDHILHQTTAPASVSKRVEEKIQACAKQIGDALNIVGTFTIELFVSGEDIYVNEMAPRPHNSGHYTIEACNISQFGQHIRAICGLPLMDIKLLQPAIMLNILGDTLETAKKVLADHTFGHVHLYGKEEAKPKRKMGHVTFVANTIDEIKQQQDILKEDI